MGLSSEHYEFQRCSIQEDVDGYFRRRVDISPRALAALQGSYRADWDGDLVIPAESVFEAVLQVSPSALVALFRAGVPVEKLFRDRYKGEGEGPAPLASNTLDWIFRGVMDPFDGEYPRRCKAARQVWHKRTLTELDLFQAFFQTAYNGPVTFREKVDYDLLKQHLTDVGRLLIEAGFVEPEDATEHWDENDENMGTYRARSIAATRLRTLAEQISGVSAIDASHDLFQFALWQDSGGRIRLRPFGLGSMGRSAPEFIKDGQSLVFRDGILQPVTFRSGPIGGNSIQTLEDMMNSEHCNELDFQRFFHANPIFLAGLDYKQIHPQLVLFNQEGPSLVPDFMLEPLDTRFCDLLELKLPYGELVRRLRSGSRSRFRATVDEAVAQLTEYRRHFESTSNRNRFHATYGLHAYYPRMILVIGRRHHFRDDVERNALKTMLPKDLDLWTYDDLLARAKRYISFATQPSDSSRRE